jgi:nickel transport protein
MKVFIRRGATLLAAGGVLLSTLFAVSSRVLALTDEQVAERLRNVPVFTITDEEGSPLVTTPPDSAEGAAPVAGVFISQSDAQEFLDTLREDDPELAGAVRVVPVSLAEVYELALAGQDPDQRLEFMFIPSEEEVATAVTLLQSTGEEISSFEGVPLFVARSNTDGEEGYLTIQQGNQQVIPMFFKEDDLQAMLERLQQVQPDLATTVDIQVINLEGLINTLENSDNPELERILLIPPEESVDYIREQQGSPAQAPQ